MSSFLVGNSSAPVGKSSAKFVFVFKWNVPPPHAGTMWFWMIWMGEWWLVTCIIWVCFGMQFSSVKSAYLTWKIWWYNFAKQKKKPGLIKLARCGILIGTSPLYGSLWNNDLPVDHGRGWPSTLGDSTAHFIHHQVVVQPPLWRFKEKKDQAESKGISTKNSTNNFGFNNRLSLLFNVCSHNLAWSPGRSFTHTHRVVSKFQTPKFMV